MRTLAPPWTWTSSRSLVCQLDGLWKMECSWWIPSRMSGSLKATTWRVCTTCPATPTTSWRRPPVHCPWTTSWRTATPRWDHTWSEINGLDPPRTRSSTLASSGLATRDSSFAPHGERRQEESSWRRVRAEKPCSTMRPSPTAMPRSQSETWAWMTACHSWKPRRKSWKASFRTRSGSLTMPAMPLQTGFSKPASSWLGRSMRMEPQGQKHDLWCKASEIQTLTLGIFPLRHQLWRASPGTSSWVWPLWWEWLSSLATSLRPSCKDATSTPIPRGSFGWNCQEMEKNYLAYHQAMASWWNWWNPCMDFVMLHGHGLKKQPRGSSTWAMVP